MARWARILHVGSYGMLSPCDSDSDPDQPVADAPVGPYVTRGPVGSYGMLSPCNSDSDPDQPVADGPVGPYVTCGPVGSYGMLSLCDSDSDSDLPVADGPVGPYVARGPVGSYGMLSPCNSDSDPDQPVADGPMGPYVTRGPVGSYGTSSPCDSDTPGPVMPMRTFPQSHQGGGECIDMHGGMSGSNIVGTPTAVAVVDLRAGSTLTDVSTNGVDDCEDWDSGYQLEIIDGVTVYYGGDLCDSEDSEESDWEDPEDVARREYVDDYNLDLLEDMEPMVFVPGGNRLDSIGGMSTRLICMTGMMPVFLTMILLWIVNVGLGGNIVLRFFGRDCSVSIGCGCVATEEWA